MTLAQRLKRVFGIDIETCPICAGAARIIACIEHPHVIAKPLTYLDAKVEPQARGGRHAGRRPSGDCSTDQSMTTSFTRLHHPLTRWGFARPVGVKVPKNRVVTRHDSWNSGGNPHPKVISWLEGALRIQG